MTDNVFASLVHTRSFVFSVRNYSGCMLLLLGAQRVALIYMWQNVAVVECLPCLIRKIFSFLQRSALYPTIVSCFYLHMLIQDEEVICVKPQLPVTADNLKLISIGISRVKMLVVESAAHIANVVVVLVFRRMPLPR